MRKIFKFTGGILLFAAFALAILVFISTFFGIDKYVVISGSMEPNIPTGSVAVVNQNILFDDVKNGDVIVFRYNDMNIIHRVVDETVIDGEKHLKTKGDANRSDDGYLTTANNYCGKALFHIPKVFGFMIDFFKMLER